jgi:hypothetical protein
VGYAEEVLAEWERVAGLPCQSQWEALRGTRVHHGVHAKIRRCSRRRNGPLTEQEEGLLQVPPSRECNRQDCEVHSESPQGDRECPGCRVVCRPPSHEDTGEDG